MKCYNKAETINFFFTFYFLSKHGKSVQFQPSVSEPEIKQETVSQPSPVIKTP